jgi:hypothetical protein
MFDLNDLFNPALFDVSGSPQRRNYNYKTTVNFNRPINGKNQQYITIASNELLDESSILQSSNFVAISGVYGINQDDIESIEITGAIRSSALGSAEFGGS